VVVSYIISDELLESTVELVGVVVTVSSTVVVALSESMVVVTSTYVMTVPETVWSAGSDESVMDVTSKVGVVVLVVMVSVVREGLFVAAATVVATASAEAVTACFPTESNVYVELSSSEDAIVALI